MTLLVDELYNDVVFEQPFRINRHVNLAHIRPWIYKHGVLTTGDLTLEVWQGSTLLKTAIINCVDINTQITGTYAHGSLRFDFGPLQLFHDTTQSWTEYKLKLYMDNYTNSSTFIGAIRRYELKFTDTYGIDVNLNTMEAPNDMVEPLGVELFEYIY
jgi:hypothetical protein